MCGHLEIKGLKLNNNAKDIGRKVIGRQWIGTRQRHDSQQRSRNAELRTTDIVFCIERDN
jgi:hypothetical protein